MKAIYLAIKLYIQQKFPEISHIDLWNEQISNLDEENPFLCPAIFVELGVVDWYLVSKHSKTGSLPVTLHIVSECLDTRADDSDGLKALDILDQTSDKFDNLKIPGCTPFKPDATEVDNNHGNLIHNTLSYVCDVKKCISDGKSYIEVEPEVKVTGEFLSND